MDSRRLGRPILADHAAYPSWLQVQTSPSIHGQQYKEFAHVGSSRIVLPRWAVLLGARADRGELR